MSLVGCPGKSMELKKRHYEVDATLPHDASPLRNFLFALFVTSKCGDKLDSLTLWPTLGVMDVQAIAILVATFRSVRRLKVGVRSTSRSGKAVRKYHRNTELPPLKVPIYVFEDLQRFARTTGKLQRCLRNPVCV